MPEPIDWLPDGAPYSPRFGDRYHSSANHGVDQARDAFLGGCGLPAAWAGQAQWRILETGFGLGLNFLVTWAAWRADPARPRVLHFISCEAWPVAAADLLRAAPQAPELQPLAQQLAAQFWGLLPGVHRLSFEGGQVLLTLYIGDAQAMLRQQQPVADAVYLDGFSPQCNPDMWGEGLLKAVARCCRRGTRLATWSVASAVRAGLAQCGFEVRKVPGVHPKRDNLQATFDPPWQPRGAADTPAPLFSAPSRCVVIGAGLAGAGAAASLARRGWQVEVLDQGAAPAAGASGLPAGVFGLHVSPDDAPQSRLSRAGLRLTRQTAQDLLAEGVDWAPSGVLEHCVDGKRGLPAAWSEDAAHPGSDWSRYADAAQLAAAGLPAAAVGHWHARGGWIRPARLIAALLARPGITWRGGAAVARIARADDGAWRLFDAQGALLAEAPLVVIATGAGSIGLCAGYWPAASLRPLRGQVSWGRCADAPALPPFPVNGHGNLVPCAPDADGPIWVLGSTFERGQTALPKTADELAAGRAYNLERLRGLLPGLRAPMAQRFQTPGAVHDWSAVRCAAPDRRPVVGPIDPQALPGLCISTALGARGLTNALLCGELLAAQVHGEPLPLEAKVAQALAAQRLRK